MVHKTRPDKLRVLCAVLCCAGVDLARRVRGEWRGEFVRVKEFGVRTEELSRVRGAPLIFLPELYSQA
jgi:hypothetical protein